MCENPDFIYEFLHPPPTYLVKRHRKLVDGERVYVCISVIRHRRQHPQIWNLKNFLLSSLLFHKQVYPS